MRRQGARRAVLPCTTGARRSRRGAQSSSAAAFAEDAGPIALEAVFERVSERVADGVETQG
ncbi:hypothetical protein [Streptomyces sp. NPDC101149]|uniref:hypothetical protein n=1 Tax=Streptomyces sp. NPDC101149 TaxID=3366113 RepID=UPI00380FC509